MTRRLTSSSLAGTSRKLVAVGTSRLASMLATMRAAAPAQRARPRRLGGSLACGLMRGGGRRRRAGVAASARVGAAARRRGGGGCVGRDHRDLAACRRPGRWPAGRRRDRAAGSVSRW